MSWLSPAVHRAGNWTGTLVSAYSRQTSGSRFLVVCNEHFIIHLCIPSHSFNALFSRAHGASRRAGLRDLHDTVSRHVYPARFLRNGGPTNLHPPQDKQRRKSRRWRRGCARLEHHDQTAGCISGYRYRRSQSQHAKDVRSRQIPVHRCHIRGRRPGSGRLTGLAGTCTIGTQASVSIENSCYGPQNAGNHSQLAGGRPQSLVRRRFFRLLERIRTDRSDGPWLHPCTRQS